MRQEKERGKSHSSFIKENNRLALKNCLPQQENKYNDKQKNSDQFYSF